MKLVWYIIIFLLTCVVLLLVKYVYITHAIKADFKTIENRHGELTTNILKGYYVAYNNYSNELSENKRELVNSEHKRKRISRKIAELEKILAQIDTGRNLYLKLVEDYEKRDKFDDSVTIFSRDLRNYLAQSAWKYVKKEI